MAVATLAMLGTTAASVAPIELTEAAWTDSVHANASFTASPNVGINYARGLGAYGEFVRDYSLLGDAVTMTGYTASRTTGQTPITLSNDEPFSSESIFLALPFAMSGVRCARAQPSSTDCALSSTATSYALADVTEFRVHATNPFGVPTTPLVVYEPSSSTNPLRVTASCNPGTSGNTGLAGSGSFTLGSGDSTKTLALPTKAAPRKQQVRETSSYRYRVALLYTEDTALNSAWAQVAINIRATNPRGTTTYWSVDAILARAECGNSQPLPGLPTRPTQSNPAVVWDTSFPNSASAPLAPLAASDPDSGLSTERGEDVQSAPSVDGLPATSEAGHTATTTSTTASRFATSTRPSTSTATRMSASTTQVPTATTPKTTTTPQATKTITTTSAAPAVVIPDEPGPLSPSARLEDVGTATVGGDDLLVVVAGDTVPTDAQQGLAALEIWLGGGDPGDTWATFTSDDAEQDGWRWAAVNQKTGTVVYIR